MTEIVSTSLTNHAAGTGTCSQSRMTIPSYLSPEMHVGKFPDHTEFQIWIVNFRTEVLLKGEESHARFAVDQGNRSNQIAGCPHHSEVNNGQRFQ